MKKLRFFGLLVTVLLLAFGLMAACDSSTPKEDNVVEDTITYTSGNVVITFSNKDIDARARALESGYKYLIKRVEAILSQGTITVDGKTITFYPTGGGEAFQGQLTNSDTVLTIANANVGSETLNLQAAKDGSGSGGGAGGGGGGGGGGGSGGGGGTGGGGTVPIPVDPDVISTVALTITLPSPGVTGSTKATVATTAQYDVDTLTWSPILASGNVFEPNTVYTVTVELKRTGINTFQSTVSPTINAKAATVTSRSTTAMTISNTFPATTETVYEIKLLSESMKWDYVVGDTINFAGLAVELTYATTPNHTYETVPAASFSQKGVTMVTSSGALAVQVGDVIKVLDDFNTQKIQISAGAGQANHVVTTSNSFNVKKTTLDIKAGSAEVTFGAPPLFKGDKGGASAKIDLLKIPTLFTGIPNDILASGTVFKVETVTGTLISTGKGSVGTGSGSSILTVTGTGVIYISFTINSSVEPKYLAAKTVVAPLTVNKGTIEVVRLPPITKEYSSTGVTVELSELYEFKMADGTVISPGPLTTGVATVSSAFTLVGNSGTLSGSASTTPKAWTVTGGTPNFTIGNFRVQNLGTFTTGYTFPTSPVGALYNTPSVPSNTITVKAIPIPALKIEIPTPLNVTGAGLRRNTNTLAATGTGIHAASSANIIGTWVPTANTPAFPAGATDGALLVQGWYIVSVPVKAMDKYHVFSKGGEVGAVTVVTASGTPATVVGWDLGTIGAGTTANPTLSTATVRVQVQTVKQ